MEANVAKSTRDEHSKGSASQPPPQQPASQPKQSTKPVTQSTQHIKQSTQSTSVAQHNSQAATTSRQTNSNPRQVPFTNSPKGSNNRYRNNPKYNRVYTNSSITPKPINNQQPIANTSQSVQPANPSSPQVAQPVPPKAAPRQPAPQPAPRRNQNGAQPPSTSKPRTPKKEKTTKMIIVTGFPPYIQPIDLLNVFEAFSSLKIIRLNPRYSTMSFETEEEAIEATKLNNKINLYGDFLTVKLYYGRPGEEPKHSPKREFARTKEKSITIDPKQIDLSGDFHSQLDNILSTVRLTQEDVTKLSQLYTDVEYALQSIWPGCKTIPFGSITTGLGVKTSDADCFVEVPPQFRHPQANYVVKAKKILQYYPKTFSEILCIPRASTPIVKFFHVPTETSCDLTFKTPLGAQNSKLIAFLLHADPRLIPMAVVIKYWAKVHDFTGTGKLTNYTLTMMIIFYLQQPPISILPSIAWLQSDPATEYIVDSWNAGFMCQRERLPPSSNTSAISELLGGFFEYYSIFNFEDMVICPFLGAPVPKNSFKDTNLLPKEFDRYKANVLANFVMPIRYGSAMCVQDPLDQSHNVASAVTTRLAADIRAYFKHAAAAYEKEKLNRNLEFLKIILLQAPVLTRPKSHQEFRVNLFPRIIASIVDPDWKSVVRGTIMKIFEKLLKIKLGKVEETVKPDSKKQREKYTGDVNKAIWRRKNFTKLYNATNLDFETKQIKITDEILLVDKQPIDINFHLNLMFCLKPPSAVVSMRLVSTGQVEEFREFGKWFISNMQHWFIELIKPLSKPLSVNVAETINMIDKNAEEVPDSSDSDVENTPQNQTQKENENESAVEENPANKETGNLSDECTTQ